MKALNKVENQDKSFTKFEESHNVVFYRAFKIWSSS